jgi:hypothetical protein
MNKWKSNKNKQINKSMNNNLMFGQEVHTNNIMSTIPLEGRHCNRQGGQD